MTIPEITDPQLTDNAPTLSDDSPAIHAAPCSRCGCPTEEYDKFCPACGTPREEALGNAVEATVVEETSSETSVDVSSAQEQKHIRCKNCGAEVAVDQDQRSYVCAFCDSTYVVEFSPEETDRQPPEFVIGFAVTKEQAQEKFHRWIAENSWFRPGDLKMAQVEEKLRGVYLPFWSFSMLAESDWSARIGEYWYRTETYTTRENGKTVTKTRRVRETEWWPLAGKHHFYYSGYLVSGSRGLAQKDANRIKPFHLPALKRYEPHYLAGWLAEEYSVGRDESLDMCQREFYRREQSNVANHLPGDTHQSLRVDTRFSDVNSDLILLPVYLLSYRHGEKLFRFLVNGQTGKVAGDKPISAWRIGAAIGAGVFIVLVVAILIALFGGL